ncbi:dNA mismatch repair protein MutL [Firmicutes bacterium CAG:884]|nr:dNA mismatch repair protein MutL [Firmicutes bacterium CAG:884]
MPIIKVMSEILANKIAAGEVVERCSSVVKELVENSIDAGSTEIKVDLLDSGITEIKVTDNGVGMDEADAKTAFQRHATSKLLDENDLYRINTLGFRGEALPSIASVSKVELVTSKGLLGTRVKINGGNFESIERAEARRGTSIAVRNLFYNTPARLKHLSSMQAELMTVADYVDKIALSHPNIRFVLTNNGSTMLNTDGKGDLLKTINSVFGINVARNMIKIETEDRDYKVMGYISKPEINRTTKNHMITLVNGRVVRNSSINRAINDSYHTYKPDNRYPIVVINIEVDPSQIDVNIHPTKMDIKFSKLEELQNLLMKEIKKNLDVRTLIPKVEEAIVVNNFTDYEEEKPIKQEEKPIFVKQELEIHENEVKYETKREENRYPDMTFVGIAHGTYIIMQNDTGMYIIDQHAAKERINYEKFKEELGHPSQNKIPLLFPITLEYTTSEFMKLREKMDVLNNIGLLIEEFGINSIIVKAHPVWFPKGFENQYINKVIETVLNYNEPFDLVKFNEKVAINLSCKMAIKANEYISPEEAIALIKNLQKCEQPFNCPHGRPTTLIYTVSELEHLFKRSGFDTKK